MISIRNLTFAYRQTPVLKGVSFDLPEGGLTALLGCNGAGKTTLFRCMLGLLPGYKGTMLLDGKEMKTYFAQQLARKIASIPQSHYPAFNYSVRDMVLMGTTQQTGMFASPGKEQRRIADEAMDRIGILPLADRGFAQLSGGEKQLVLIARALAQQAKILFMDEPTSALDYGNQLRVMEQVRLLGQQGYTVILSTHTPQHALSFADRVLALHDGVLLRDGKPEDVMDPDLMKTLYGVDVVFAETEFGKAIVNLHTAL